MWDEVDYLGRWIQGFCAIFLALFALADAYMLWHTSFVFFYFLAGIGALFGSVRLCWRCFWYAVTGKNNVNRDDF
jgi:hypothetical protein